jgi:biopolymer transport protein TolQ
MNQSLSILIKSYLDSDFFGKGIFLGLFFLSISCWVVIGWKFWHFKLLKKVTATQMALLESAEEGILSLQFPKPEDAHVIAFYHLFHRMKTKTLKVLEKNQYFSKEPNAAVFLTKDDLEMISEDLQAGIAKEMKTIESGLFILNSSVSLSPFLGILGTVWGILISLFEMQKGSSALSNTIIIQGLSTALATTVIGLLIAIPALIGYAFLKNLTKSIALDFNLFSSEMLSKLELQYKKVN